MLAERRKKGAVWIARSVSGVAFFEVECREWEAYSRAYDIWTFWLWLELMGVLGGHWR